MMCEGIEERQVSAALNVIKFPSLLMFSEDGERVTVHALIQQTIQQYVIDQNNEKQSVVSCLFSTLLKLLPSLEEIRTGHKLADDSVKKYAPHLCHIANIVVDCHVRV
jgi:hypothetical protein